MSNLKEKIKTNFNKNPKAVGSLAALAIAAALATIGSLTGVVEPETASNAIATLLRYITFGV